MRWSNGGMRSISLTRADHWIRHHVHNRQLTRYGFYALQTVALHGGHECSFCRMSVNAQSTLIHATDVRAHIVRPHWHLPHT